MSALFFEGISFNVEVIYGFLSAVDLLHQINVVYYWNCFAFALSILLHILRWITFRGLMSFLK